MEVDQQAIRFQLDLPRYLRALRPHGTDVEAAVGIPVQYMDCTARESLDTNFSVACDPSKQEPPFLP
jgi:hypothetical protein